MNLDNVAAYGGAFVVYSPYGGKLTLAHFMLDTTLEMGGLALRSVRVGRPAHHGAQPQHPAHHHHPSRMAAAHHR
jgi:hypothetical protein